MDQLPLPDGATDDPPLETLEIRLPHQVVETPEVSREGNEAYRIRGEGRTTLNRGAGDGDQGRGVAILQSEIVESEGEESSQRDRNM